MDLRTQSRYDNAKGEGVIETLSAHARSQELEQIGHEEDGLKVLRALEAEGWMKILFPAWSSAKADEAKLMALHDLAAELLLQGVHPDMSAAQMQLLTAKLAPKDLNALKKSMLRPGFVAEWKNLDSGAAGFAKALLAKQNAKPSACYKLFMSYEPEAVLWLGFTSKAQAIQERFNLFLKVWPEARQRIPYVLMQEMRITPELPAYGEIVQGIFLELIDGRLTTPEEMRAYLEPHSPPAPPPQMTVKRPRARRTGAKLKVPAFEEDEESDEALTPDEDLEPISVDDDDEEIDLGLVLPKGELAKELGDEEESEEDEELEAGEIGAVSAAREMLPKPAPANKGEKLAPGKAEKPLTAAKPEPPGVKTGTAPKPSHAAKPDAAKPPARPQAVPSAKHKPAPTPVAAKSAKVAKPAGREPVPAKDKALAKTPPKTAAKAPAKKPAKSAPAKSQQPKPKPVKHIPEKPSKPAAKKAASKTKK
jgi:hypothetical protein